MRQYIIIIVAIVIVVILNFWQVTYLKQTSRYILTDINEIDNSVKRDDFKAALTGIKQLEKTWEAVKPGWDIFGEHDDIEQLTEHIESMKVYAEYADKEELVNEYTLLESVIKHIIDTEKINFSNVL